MIKYAVFVFALAAAVGLVLAAHLLRGRFPAWVLSLIHAAIGATGLVLVLVALLDGVGGLALGAFATLVVAALGGFFLAYRHWREDLPPKAIVVVHALVAVIGFGMLIVVALGVG